ncbi:MAG: flagellar biosynthetic protein FliO [Ruminococcaceae bacterium]|nr:flagellar biosynthetic protein FliO [Oscillospiraceae bacterium]
MESIKEILAIVGMLILMCGVFALAYFASKALGARYSGTSAKASKIEVVDRAYIGKGQTLLLARVADKIILLGATPQTISALGEFSPDSFVWDEGEKEKAVSFFDTLKEAIKTKGGKQTGGSEDGENGNAN